MSSDVSQSGRYTHGHESSTLASHGTRTAENSAAYLLPHLRPGLSVLDVGCGPGTITLDLAEVVAPGVVVGLENVEAPLQTARSAAERRGDQGTRFEVGDVLALPYADAGFDVVHAHQVLQHLTDPVAALREMSRVCRPDGWIAVRDADYAAMSWYPELPGLDLWRDCYRAVARANGAEPDAARRYRTWGNQAGLVDPRLSATVWNYAEEGSCRWWGHSQADRCEGTTFTRQALQQGRTDSDVAAMAAAWREWGDHPQAWFAIVHAELLGRPGTATTPR